jgi:hypothetical protein
MHCKPLPTRCGPRLQAEVRRFYSIVDVHLKHSRGIAPKWRVERHCAPSGWWWSWVCTQTRVARTMRQGGATWVPLSADYSLGTLESR